MAGIFSKFFGGAVSTATGVAVGGAVQPTLNPLLQLLVNETWKLYPDVPVPAVLAVIGVAQGQIERGAAESWAAEQGYGGAQFDAMLAAADTGPGVAQAFELWRRGLIDEGGFRKAAKREALEAEWIDALVGLKRRLLSPAELANAVVQGFKTVPQASPDAEKQGYTAADFQTMVDVTGLPPGPETGLDWLRRGILTDAEFAQLVKEGHTKPKYIPFYEQARNHVLSAAEYAGLRLRGWITAQESYTGGALTGYDQAEMDLLFLNRGRPATPRQIRVGYARGATVPGSPGGVDAAITKAVKESDIRPEYTAVEIAASYSLPSPFVLRGLTQSGALTQAQAEKILLESGWLPEYAKAAAAFFAKSGGTTGKAETKAELQDEYAGGYMDEPTLRTNLAALGYTGNELELEVHLADARRVKRWREKAVDAIGKAYIEHGIGDAEALVDLQAAGVTGQAANLLLPYWKLERRVAEKHLTAAQVKRAYKKNLLTQEQAMVALEALDYSAADATVYLAS